ncbi:hypothetical protein PO909_000735 [Leuciscus waleckii]
MMMDQEDADGQNHQPKPRTLCRYLSKWETTFHYLTSSHEGPHYAYCKMCRCNFSVGHGGKNDVSQHDKSLKHKRANHTLGQYLPYGYTGTKYPVHLMQP